MAVALMEPRGSVPCSYRACNTEWNGISLCGQTEIPIFVPSATREPDSDCQKRLVVTHSGKCEILTHKKQFSSNWSVAKIFWWLLKITWNLWTSTVAAWARLWICSKTKLNSVVLVRERTMPTERTLLVGEVVPTFADRGCCVSAQQIPTAVNLDFLDRINLFY
jgi:hypothetical protein